MLRFFHAFVLMFCFVFCEAAFANILITPTKVVFKERDRFSVVTLVNNGQVTKSYEIGWVRLRMKEGDGAYVPVEDGDAAGSFDLSQYVVFTPRRVTLAPGAKQKVRLALRRPEVVPDGDHYVHLKFRALPDDVSSSPVRKEGERAEANVKINVSYTIPVVLRVGDADYQASVGQIALDRNANNGALEVKVPVSRGGLYSVLGWLQVYHVVDGREELLGEVSNAHIFSEISSRVFTVPLTKEVSSGGLKIVMRHYDLSQDIVYTERYFPLQ